MGAASAGLSLTDTPTLAMKTNCTDSPAAATPSQMATAASDLQGTRDVLDQWVETSQLISKEKVIGSWSNPSLPTPRHCSPVSSSDQRQPQELQASASAADQTAQLTAAKNCCRRERGGSQIRRSTQIKRILKTLPEPLIEKIQPLVRRLPENPANTKLSFGERTEHRRHPQPGRQV